MEALRLLLRSLAALTLALYLSIGTLGMLAPARMGMAGGSTPACAIMAHTGSLCPMSVADHLNSWQLFPHALPKARHFVVALAMFLSGIILVTSSLHSARRRRHGNPDPPPDARSVIQQLISRGIVQPLVYE